MNTEQMLDQVKSWKFKQDGADARILRCQQEPRISVHVKYNPKLQKSSQVWSVDGIAHISFEAAMAKLINSEQSE